MNLSNFTLPTAALDTFCTPQCVLTWDCCHEREAADLARDYALRQMVTMLRERAKPPSHGPITKAVLRLADDLERMLPKQEPHSQ